MQVIRQWQFFRVSKLHFVKTKCNYDDKEGFIAHITNYNIDASTVYNGIHGLLVVASEVRRRSEKTERSRD